MTRRICVLNQKGGVGKTTTAVNLAAALALRKFRVLLIDFDAQHNASQFLGIEEELEPRFNAARMVKGEGDFAPLRNVLDISGLDVVPGTQLLSSVEPEMLRNLLGGPRMLRRAVDRVASAYDYVLIDCGPHLGMLTLNVVLACPEVLVPIECAHAAAMGAMALRDYLEQTRSEAEVAEVRLLGVVPTFFDDRQKTPQKILETLRGIFGELLFHTAIHTSAEVQDAAGKGAPIVYSSPKSRGALEYQSLAQEVINRVA
jgi:chromosome partitioning protein